MACAPGDRDVSDDIDRTYRDRITDDVSVLTVFEQQKQRWLSVVIGGRLDGWFIIDPDDPDPVVQHCKAIEAARGSSDAV
jgi:hypothetical protein